MKEIEYKFKEFTNPITPRERLEKCGEQKLSNQELLAIILRTGSHNESVHVLSQKILEQYKSLYVFKMASLEELQQIKGIGRNKAILIKAMIELGRRIHFSTCEYGEKVTSSGGLAQRLIEQMKDFEQEHFLVIFLNTKNLIIKEITLFIGSLNKSVAHPREIFKEALKVSAASVILAHNHPSGEANPSLADIKLTKRIEKASFAIGIRLLDHLIIGKKYYFSMREHSLLREC
ncbi:MAG: DNA repair protein RadC [Streptococcaceae bacterium]|jgi:DNA repair protein RadC|nr:DNA repair protein RadC [Streptococcaceae bacterium]